MIISIGRLVQIFITLIMVRAFTSLLSASEVGNLYLINSLAMFIGLSLVNPVGMYINRRLHQWLDEGSIFNNFFIFNLYMIFLSLLSVIIVFFLNKAAGVGSSIDLRHLMVFMMFSVFFATWNQVFIPSLNMLNHRVSFIIFTLLTLSLGLGFSIVLVKTVAHTAVIWLTGSLLAQMLVTVFAFFYFSKVTGIRLDLKAARATMTRENLSVVAAFCLPLGIATFFMWLQNHSYRMVIERTIGLEFLALISLGFSISSNIALAVESVLHQFYFPFFYRDINTYDEDKRAAAWKIMAEGTIPAYVSLTLMLSFLAPYLVNILAGDKFEGAWIYVVFGAWAELFRMSTNILAAVAHSEMQTRYLIKSNCAGGLLAVFGVYFASKWPFFELTIPIVLVTSWFVTTQILYGDMKKIMTTISINRRGIGKAVLLSLPFALAVFLNRDRGQIYHSIAVSTIFVLYFVAIQLVTLRPLLKRKLP